MLRSGIGVGSIMGIGMKSAQGVSPFAGFGDSIAVHLMIGVAAESRRDCGEMVMWLSGRVVGKEASLPDRLPLERARLACIAAERLSLGSSPDSTATE